MQINESTIRRFVFFEGVTKITDWGSAFLRRWKLIVRRDFQRRMNPTKYGFDFKKNMREKMCCTLGKMCCTLGRTIKFRSYLHLRNVHFSKAFAQHRNTFDSFQKAS